MKFCSPNKDTTKQREIGQPVKGDGQNVDLRKIRLRIELTDMTDSTAGLHWITQQIMTENPQVQLDIINFKLEMNTLQRANNQTSTRLQRQALGAAAVAAASAVLGVGIDKNSDKFLCFIKSVLGG